MVTVKNYTHSASEKKITLIDYSVIPIERIAKIINATTESVVFDRYKFENDIFERTKSLGEISVTNNVITYVWAQDNFSDNDKFVIILYETDKEILSVQAQSDNFSYDAAGRLRVSELYTNADLKMLNGFDEYLFSTAGTGTGLFSGNKQVMSVTAGQYYIMQSRCFQPYFSGKSSQTEYTMVNFHNQTGVEKEFGRFSSSNVAPYNTNYDGFRIVNTGTTIQLEVYRAGTTVYSLDWTLWDNYQEIADYDFTNFTVWATDFLWLGGAVLRLFLKRKEGFVLCHSYSHADTNPDLMMLSPNLPIRYGIRSTTGTGTFTYICSQESSEGTADENGNSFLVRSPLTALLPHYTIADIGTRYVVKAIRLKSGEINRRVQVEGSFIEVNSTNDRLFWEIVLNPTFSAPLTFTDVVGAPIQEANGSAVQAITTTASGGYSIGGSFLGTSQSVSPDSIRKNYRSILGSKIDGTLDVIALVATPLTANISLNGALFGKFL